MEIGCVDEFPVQSEECGDVVGVMVEGVVSIAVCEVREQYFAGLGVSPDEVC